MSTSCTHLEAIVLTELPDPVTGCEECLATGGWWVHLRMCQSCGHIGCCDSSPSRHASAHARDAGHPIARSAEPGENWSWCYTDEVSFVVRGTPNV
jgi:ubiquitin-hydrolase Zn-finger-containing protein